MPGTRAGRLRADLEGLPTTAFMLLLTSGVCNGPSTGACATGGSVLKNNNFGQISDRNNITLLKNKTTECQIRRLMIGRHNDPSVRTA